MCHCSNMRVERMLNKSQHTKLILGQKILPLLLLGIKLAIFFDYESNVLKYKLA